MDDEVTELHFECELVNSNDDLITTVIIRTDQPPSPDDLAYVLRKYADKIESLAHLSEASNTMN